MRCVFLVLVLVATSARAQGVPSVDDWNTKALATYAVVSTIALGWLVREIVASSKARLDDTRAFAEALAQAREQSAVLVQQLSDFTGTLKELVRLLITEKER